MRPYPPEELLSDLTHDRFEPAPDLRNWVRMTFLNEDSKLFNPEHAHLREASLGFLWTNAENSRNMRTVIGQAELMPPMAMGKWQRARACMQIEDWFDGMPDFLLTFSAMAATTMDDISFCALVEHELYHCAQKMDDHGAPKFKQDGTPAFAIRGHDVEEFVGVVARYGMTGAVKDMVDAALATPTVPRLDIARACGTCKLKAA